MYCCMYFAAVRRADCRLACCACGTWALLWLSELGVHLHFVVCAEEADWKKEEKRGGGETVEGSIRKK